MLAIQTEALTKTYEGKGGCRNISLEVPPGCVFGLLGPNGAGKSSLVKTLVGLLRPTSGSGLLLGSPLNTVEVRKRIGFLPENFKYHEWLSGIDLLNFHGALFGLPKKMLVHRIPQVVDLVGLTGHENKKVGSYSKGMQQRIGLACALLPDPDLLFLDEPTSALDPIGRKEVRDLLVRLRGQGKTVFLNSHLLSELETVCDQIAIIKAGQMLFQGDWRILADKTCRVRLILGHPAYPNKEAIQRLPHTLQALSDLQTSPKQRQVLSVGSAAAGAAKHNDGLGNNVVEVLLEGITKQDIPALVRQLINDGFNVYEVVPVQESLENLFLETISRGGHGEGGEVIC